jgi:hypothetical protein
MPKSLLAFVDETRAWAKSESTTLRCMYELHTEHDFSALPQQIDIGSPASLLAILITDKQSGNPPGAHGAQGEAASQP